MVSRNDLDLEKKVNLIRDKECGLSHRELKDKFQSVSSSNEPSIEASPSNNDTITIEKQSLDELDKVLKHVTINGDIMSATDFVKIDEDAPVFNQWNDGIENVLAVSTINNDDTVNDEGVNLEHPPTLCEALTIVKRLHSLSTTQHPELHVFISQLQSKLIDIYLDSNCSKQKSIRDFLSL
ncbi:unnamed protein product [Rotaria magnacalcarata]|uniref:Uncharacterized protein n=2 Tax=Rotaria magnacalcarata TaxID=392030 RepID=A0A820Q430_9BILA|nr:unnamed protein product [Rotaria magnacalcarata]CAF2256386.1 unnamed protein product [Rotaria magnacalcarata]CAF4418214.1 unnamed protein product [Rotaria magnacalcarata]